MSMVDHSYRKGWIAWFARNPVAANLLMISILVVGAFCLYQTRTEDFPAFPPTRISASVTFNSGSAQETERSVTEKLERALVGMVGIKKLTSSSTANGSTITIEKTSGTDLEKLLIDVKGRLDAVTLPGKAERPIITPDQEIESAIEIEIYGDVEQDVLDAVSRQVKARLLEDERIPNVAIGGKKTEEITIEVQEDALQRYGLSLSDVVAKVRETSLVTERSSLKGEGGRILLKADNQGYFQKDFASIPIVSSGDGKYIPLGDVATISDAYTDDETLFRYDGMPARRLTVQMLGKADLLPIAKGAREIVEEIAAEGTLPVQIKFAAWNDRSILISDRLSLMLKNGLTGMMLVLVTLSLFLNLRTAAWVAIGLPVTIAGTLILMSDSLMGLTLNEMTIFGFIIVLGIVVDDSIIVAESVHHTVEQEGDGPESVIKGVYRVATPAIFGVLTTIAAFYPLTLLTGELAEIFSLFAWVVVFALIFSIIESKFILPAHLIHIRHSHKAKNPLSRGWKFVQGGISNGLNVFRDSFYVPAIGVAVKWRYLAVIAFLGISAGAYSLINQGIVRFEFWTEIPGNVVTATYKGEPDLGYGRLFTEALRIEDEARKLNEELAKQEPSGLPPITGIETTASDNGTVKITAIAARVKDRTTSVDDFTDMWRDAVGPVEGAQILKFSSAHFEFADFSVDLLLDDTDELISASQLLERWLVDQGSVTAVTNSLQSARERVNIQLTEYGRSIGLTSASVSEQIYQAVSGAEVQRFQRNDQEVKVRVRYPLDQRNSKAALKQLYVRTPSGQPVLLSAVATLKPDYTVDQVLRRSGKRVATLEAQLDKGEDGAAGLEGKFENEFVPMLKKRFPSVQIEFGGEIEQEQQALSGLTVVFIITILAIYALLAIPLRSYFQPLIVMSAIPFGIVGAVLGHWIIGIPFSMLSINGIFALAGIVVNDSLLLVSAYNDNRRQGEKVRKSLVQAGSLRMRAVILTSVTTFAGLAPMIFETAEQAQFLVPAAVSLGFGILFATIITLFLIPSLLMIQEDFKKLFSWRV